MASNNKTMTKQEILRQIELEEQKIKDAEEKKKKYVLESSNQVSVVKTGKSSSSKSKKSSSKKSKSNKKDKLHDSVKSSDSKNSKSSKNEEKTTWTYVSPLSDSNEATVEKLDASQESKASDEVGKLFYTLSIICGVLLIVVIVILLLGIGTDWFKTL